MKTLDAGQAETNKLIEKVEKRVNKEYSQATKDMQKKLNDYLKSFEKKDKEQQKALADGLITDKQYKDWRFGQIMVGQKWQEQLDLLSKDLENSRQIAMNIVSGELPSAYAIGHNYGTYLVENGSKLNTSYTLYDRDTVAKLIKDRPKLLPDPTKGSKTQMALKEKQIQKWSKAKMTSAIAQGVLQGEAIPKIAERLRTVTDMSYRASIRNARTMLTSSENLGRQASFERAQDMGIEMQKQWMATLDDRTRDSHALMDGERVDLDESFSNGLDYPADPSGDPEEVYNCRCTMVTAIKNFEKAITDFDLSENEKLGGMSYEEWKDSHLHGDEFEEPEETEVRFPELEDMTFAEVAEELSFEDQIAFISENVGFNDTEDVFRALQTGELQNEKLEAILERASEAVRKAEEELRLAEEQTAKAFASDNGQAFKKLIDDGIMKMSDQQLMNLADRVSDFDVFNAIQNADDKALAFREIAEKAFRDAPKMVYNGVEYTGIPENAFGAFGATQKITEAERASIYRKGWSGGYIQTSNSFDINRMLRTGRFDELSDKNKKTVEDLRAVIKKNQLPMDTRLVRFVDDGYLQATFGTTVQDIQAIAKSNPEALKSFIGTEITEPQFMSASTDVGANVFTGRPVRLDILAPKGTNAYITNNIGESECIFSDGVKYVLEDFRFESEKDKFGFVTETVNIVVRMLG